MSKHRHLDIGHLAARFVGVTLPMGLTLDEVVIQGESIHLETHPFSITMPKEGSIEARVSDSSLLEFLNLKAPSNVSDIKVRFEDGLIHLDANVSMIISIAVSATCKLVIQDGTLLFVELVKVDSIGGSGAFNLLQKQLDSLNPLIDANELPIAARLESVETEGRWLVLKGCIAPTK